MIYKNILFLLLFLTSFSGLAEKVDVLSLSMDDFFKIEKNQKLYDEMVKNGKIDRSRALFNEACLKNSKNDKEKSKCKCIAAEINKVDGKLFMYDSIVSYQLFNAKIAAKNNGNDEKYKRLVEVGKNRNGLTKILEKACGKL